jgi:hypothetical protein
VFDALTARDGELRDLIVNSNRVFQTTASRDEQLKAAFIALPTFERESRATLRRLTLFAENTNPLVTQLRPAARELSPTLTDLAALAPDLKVFFQQLNPLIDASREGFPAAEQVLEDLTPLLGQVDPALRQLNPVLEALGFYKPELTAFLANTVAATQATTVGSRGPIHYLRTMNPLNPENLAVYPKRLPSNRPNAYAFPGTFNQLRTGMPQFETRQCNRGPLPTITNTPQKVPVAPLPKLSLPVPVPSPVPDTSALNGVFRYSDQLFNDIARFAFPHGTNSAAGAPPCKQQPDFVFQGEASRYPHVKPG